MRSSTASPATRQARLWASLMASAAGCVQAASQANASKSSGTSVRPRSSSAVATSGELRTIGRLLIGLFTEYWEGLARGPPLSGGRPTLLLVSDENFIPLQTSRLARITPRCPAPR